MRVEWNKVIRYLAYTLELLVLFMLQETPGLLPPLFGARPVLLFPAVITIAMFETEIPALAFGVVGGLFCDFGLSGTLGFHALVLGVLCFFISLLVRVYLQSNIATAPSHGDCGHWPDGVLAVVLPVLLPVLPPQLRLYPPLPAQVPLHLAVFAPGVLFKPRPLPGAAAPGGKQAVTYPPPERRLPPFENA